MDLKLNSGTSEEWAKRLAAALSSDSSLWSLCKANVRQDGFTSP